MVSDQHIPEISSKIFKTLGFFRMNLAFAPNSTKEVAYKSLVQPKPEYGPGYGVLDLKLRLTKVRKFRKWQPAGHAEWRTMPRLFGPLTPKLRFTKSQTMSAR